MMRRSVSYEQRRSVHQEHHAWCGSGGLSKGGPI